MVIFVCWSCCLIIFGLLLMGCWVVIVFFMLGNYFFNLCKVFWNFSVFVVFFFSWFFLWFKFFSRLWYCLDILLIFFFIWGNFEDLGFNVDVSLLLVFVRLFKLGLCVLSVDSRFLILLSWFFFLLIFIFVGLCKLRDFLVLLSNCFIGFRVLL